MYNLALVNAEGVFIPASIGLRALHFSDNERLLSQLESVQGIVVYSSTGKSQEVLELILSIKRRVLLPIWVRSETDDLVSNKINLELGVLGNLGKEISDEEAFVIIENTLKFIYSAKSETILETHRTNELELNRLNCTMKVDEIEVNLTRLEYKMINLLASRVNQAFTYEEIYQYIWADEKEIETDNFSKRYRIANLAFQIRNKLSQKNINPKMLRTVRSVGYLLDSNIEGNDLKAVM